MTHFRRIGTKAKNTARRIAQKAEARKLLAANPNVDRRELVDRLVAQREDAGRSFRGLPASLVRRVTGKRPR